MTFQTIQVNPGSPGTLLLDESESATIVNLDSTNTLTLSDVDSARVGDPETIPLGPAVSATFDQGPIYGIAPSGQSITAIKLPYATAYVIPANSPTSNPPKVRSTSAGSGATVNLIPNPGPGFQIQLAALAITSIAVTPAGGNVNSWTAEDIVIDTDGTQYLACEIGLPGGNVNYAQSNSAGMQTFQSGPPPNHRLDLVNGGAGGTTSLRRCSATAAYYIVGVGQ